MKRHILILIAITLTNTLLKAQMITYEKPYTDAKSELLDIKTNPYVGTIDGVDQSGGGVASYRIKLQLPKGTGDVEPAFSIICGSDKRNGICGYGGNLSGASVITRGNKSLVYDGVKAGIKGNLDDAFYLDGIRLRLVKIQITGTQKDLMFSTEEFKQTLIIGRVSSTNANEIAYWTVKRTDLLESASYGYTSNSKLKGNNGNPYTLAWFINQQRDNFGNYVSYTYVTTYARSRLLDFVEYTGNMNTGLAPYNKIKFNYKERQDKITTYLAGSSIENNHLLDNILITTESASHYRTYKLAYSYNGQYSLLKDVTMFGTDGTSALNKTKFFFGEAQKPSEVTTNLEVPIPTGIDPDDVRLATIDGNLDGLSDVLLEVPDKPLYDPTCLITADLYTNGSAGTSFTKTSTPLSSNSIGSFSYFGQVEHITYGNDWSLDGKPDLVSVSTIGGIPSGFKPSSTCKVLLNQTISVGGINKTLDNPDPNNSFGAIPSTSSGFGAIANDGYQYFCDGDFNGDGQVDRFLIATNESDLQACPWVCPHIWQTTRKGFLYLSPNYYVQQVQGLPIPGSAALGAPNGSVTDLLPVQMQAIDWDGDGTMELFVLDDDVNNTAHTIRVYKFAVSSFALSVATQVYQRSNYEHAESYVPLGDFNGDGITDYLDAQVSASTSGSTVQVNYGTGYGYSVGSTYNLSNKIQRAYYLHNCGMHGGVRLYVNDFDGDGLTDIVLESISKTAFSMSNREFEILFSNGNDFKSSNFLATNSTSYYLTSMRYRYDANVGDYDGDGSLDLLYKSAINSNQKYSVLYHTIKPNNQELKLQKVINGMGNYVSYVYEKYAENFKFYEIDESALYPIIDVVPMGLGLRSIKSSNNSSEDEKHFYFYGAKYVVNGKGMLGFTRTKISIPLINTDEETEYKTNSQYFTIRPVVSKATNTATGQIMSTSENFYTYHSLTPSATSTPIYFVALDKSRIDNNFAGTYIETNYEYDGNGGIINGLVTKKTVNNSGLGSSISTFNFSSVGALDNFIAVGGNKFLNKLESQIDVATSIGNPSITTTYNYTYDASTTAVITEIINKSTIVQSTVSSTYDNFGNLLTQVIAPIGLPALGSAHEYTSNGRFLKSSINSLGEETLIVSDAQSGLTREITDHRGVKIKHSYSPFGYLLHTENLTHGFVTAYSRTWSATAGESYSESVIPPAGLGQATYYDWNGRSVRKTMATLGGIATSTTSYALDGSVSTEIKPRLPTEGVIATQIWYDAYRRPTMIWESSKGPTMINYTYSAGNLITETMRPTETVSTTVNALSSTIAYTDNGGTLNHRYNSAGKLLETKFGTAILLKNKYDNFGRLIETFNPSKNGTIYEYNSANEEVKKTEQNGNVTETFYDLLHRVSKVTTSDGNNIFYDYVATGPAKNTIASLTTLNSSGEYYNLYYQYDVYARLVQKDADINGLLLQHNYEYDLYDRETKHIYPNGFAINTDYSADGSVNKITQTSTGTILYEQLSQNGLGQVLQYKLGNGLTTSKIYSAGKVINVNTPGLPVADFNLTYDFYTSNILSRANNGNLETFTYDNNNRLVSSQVFGLGTVSYQYDDQATIGLGDLTFKEDIGAYGNQYTPQNAVKLVRNPISTPGPPGISPLVINHGEQRITFNAMQRVQSISEFRDMAGTTTLYDQTFGYFGTGDRAMSTMRIASMNPRTRYYFNDYELEQSGYDATDICYVAVPASGRIMAVTINGTLAINYSYSDHLGSITAITDASANLIAHCSYDAWGRPRNPVTWDQTPSTNVNPSWLWRGYIGQEMMPEFSLINLNARLYDYELGKMLSPDQYISLGTQGMNRYSYARNNPLLYVDPSGNSPVVAVMLMAGIMTAGTSMNNIHSPSDFFAIFSVGAVSGGLGFAAGGALLSVAFTNSGLAANFAFGAAQAGTSAFSSTLLTGLYIGNNWQTSINAAMRAGATAAVISCLTNAISFVTNEAVSAIRRYFGSDLMFSDKPKLIGNTTAIEEIDYDCEFEKTVALCPNNDGPNWKVNVHLNELPKKYNGAHFTIKDGVGYSQMRLGPLVLQERTFLGLTLPKDGNLGVDIYIMHASFQSKELLFLTTQHEFIHSFLYEKKIPEFLQELIAWKFQEAQAQHWDLQISTKGDLWNSYSSNVHGPDGFNPQKALYLSEKAASSNMEKFMQTQVYKNGSRLYSPSELQNQFGIPLIERPW
jgi:RHS repeat-associated protein